MKVAIIFLSISNLVSSDYYWRDYYGEVPNDAVPGGLDLNNQTTYIGQLFVLNHGILMTRIYKGRKAVTASRNGIHTSDIYIKIFCSSAIHNFKWFEVDSDNIHVKTINKHLVTGGTKDKFVLHIGRIQYQGELIVGKVCSYSKVSKMYYPYKGEENKADRYEVLIYEKDLILEIFARSASKN